MRWKPSYTWFANFYKAGAEQWGPDHTRVRTLRFISRLYSLPNETSVFCNINRQLAMQVLKWLRVCVCVLSCWHSSFSLRLKILVEGHIHIWENTSLLPRKQKSERKHIKKVYNLICLEGFLIIFCFLIYIFSYIYNLNTYYINPGRHKLSVLNICARTEGTFIYIC